MFVNEQDVMLEAGVEMRFESQVDYNGVMVAIYVRIYTVETLKQLAEQTREAFGEGDTFDKSRS